MLCDPCCMVWYGMLCYVICYVILLLGVGICAVEMKPEPGADDDPISADDEPITDDEAIGAEDEAIAAEDEAIGTDDEYGAGVPC